MSPWRSRRPDGRSASRCTSRSPAWARMSGPGRRRAIATTLHLGDLTQGPAGILASAPFPWHEGPPLAATTTSADQQAAPAVDRAALRALLDGEHAEIRNRCRAWLSEPA